MIQMAAGMAAVNEKHGLPSNFRASPTNKA
jgi:hypothetical protein